MERSTSFSMDLQPVGGRLVASVRGEVDISNAAELTLRLEGAARRSEGRLTVDLSGLRYMDSSGLRSLKTIHNAHPNTHLVVRSGTLVARIIAISGMGDVFEVETIRT